MKKFLKAKKEIIAIVLFVGLIGSLHYFVVLPILGKITTIKDVIVENKLKQDLKKQRLGELSKISQQYEEAGRQQAKLDILLDKQQAVVLIERLEKLAKDTDNKIVISIQEELQQQKKVAEVVTTKNASSEKDLLDLLPVKDYLKLKITLAGDYNGAFNFISSLETLEYYSDIVELSVGPWAGKEPTNVSNSSSGLLNPFSSQVSRVQVATAKDSSNELETVLGVVFYSKK